LGLIQGLSFKSVRLVLRGQLPQFPFNVILYSPTEQISWQVSFADSYSNASFPQGSALTHYALVLPEFEMMNLTWTLFGSNDRSTWLVLDHRQIQDPLASKRHVFSIHQPYPIGDSDFHNSSIPSQLFLPWILSSIPGIDVPLPFISALNSSSVHFEHFGSFSLSFWLSPLFCSIGRCIPLLISDRTADGPAIFIELLPVSDLSASTQMFAFRVCSVVDELSRCSPTDQLGSLIISGSTSLITVTFDLSSKAMTLFLNGKVASYFMNDFFFGMNISNFVFGLGYNGRVFDVVILPHVTSSVDHLFPFRGLHDRAVVLKITEDSKVSVKVRGALSVFFGIGSSELKMLQFYSQMSFNKTGSALFDFSFHGSKDFVSFGMLGSASLSGCHNSSMLTCTFSEADALAFPSSSVAFLRVDFSGGGSLTVPVSLYSSILSIDYKDPFGHWSPASQIFLSGTIWNIKYTGINEAFSHFAVLHTVNNMVIFPCSLLSNSSMLSCNSSQTNRVSPSHSRNQVLWQPITDTSVEFSVISVGTSHYSQADVQGILPQQPEVFSKILSFLVYDSGGKTKYGVVVKFSEFSSSVNVVYEDYPYPRVIELRSPISNRSCLSHSYLTKQNRKFTFLPNIFIVSYFSLRPCCCVVRIMLESYIQFLCLG
jgi:hypothetical protein